MTSVLQCKSKSLTAAVTIKPEFSPNQFGTIVHSSKSEIQWIRSGIPSRNYLRILERDHYCLTYYFTPFGSKIIGSIVEIHPVGMDFYCLHCFPQGMQRMKIVIGSSAERVCNS